jgi:hypothetical protein
MSDQNLPIDISQTPLNGTLPNIMENKDLGGDPNIAAITNLLLQNRDFQPSQLTEMVAFNNGEVSKEKERISSRMAGFNPKDNDVWRKITERFGPNIKQPELLSIAQVLSSSCNVKLDRDAKRRKSVLIKWFEENWGTISPFLDYVVLEDSGRNQ